MRELLAAVLFKPPRQPDLPPLLSLTSTRRRGLRLLVQGMGADLSCPSYDGDFDDARDARIDDVAARHAHAERRRYALPTPPSERDEPSVMHEFRRENTSAAANVDREEALEKVCLPRLGGQFDFFESCVPHLCFSASHQTIQTISSSYQSELAAKEIEIARLRQVRGTSCISGRRTPHSQ